MGSVRYWHAGWSGRKIGELLLPIARQESFYAESMRAGIQDALRTAQVEQSDFPVSQGSPSSRRSDTG